MSEVRILARRLSPCASTSPGWLAGDHAARSADTTWLAPWLLALSQHPDQHRPKCSVFLAVDHVGRIAVGARFLRLKPDVYIRRYGGEGSRLRRG